MVMDPVSANLRSTFQQRLRLPLVGMVLFSVLALTLLYYKLQDTSSLLYFQYLENLTEYKLLDQRIQRDLDRIQFGYLDDTTQLYSNMTILRDLVLTTAANAAEQRSENLLSLPPEELFVQLEQSVASRQALTKRFVANQIAWLHSADSLDSLLQSATANPQTIQDRLVLAKARQSFLGVGSTQLEPLLERKREQLTLWARLQGQGSLQCEDLSQAFRQLSTQQAQERESFQMLFYLLAMTLVLFTLFFAARRSLH
jgi:hypothetical protein